MFGYDEYASGGNYDNEDMGDLSTGLIDFATGLLSGAGPVPIAPLLGADPGSAASGALSLPGSSSSAKVTAPSGLKLRSQPNENSQQLALLDEGTVVTVVKTGFPPTGRAPKGWTQVRTEGGEEGYVSTEWLSISSPTSSSSGNAPSSPSLSLTKPTDGSSSSSSTTKLLLLGGGAIAVVLLGAALLGGKKKAA